MNANFPPPRDPSPTSPSSESARKRRSRRRQRPGSKNRSNPRDGTARSNDTQNNALSQPQTSTAAATSGEDSMRQVLIHQQTIIVSLTDQLGASKRRVDELEAKNERQERELALLRYQLERFQHHQEGTSASKGEEETAGVAKALVSTAKASSQSSQGDSRMDTSDLAASTTGVFETRAVLDDSTRGLLDLEKISIAEQSQEVGEEEDEDEEKPRKQAPKSLESNDDVRRQSNQGDMKSCQD